MKILQINSSKSYGGGERHFVDLCRGLSEAGQEVHVALRPACEWKNRLDFLGRDKLNFLSMLNSTDVFSAQKLAKIVRENNLDIIHAHVARDYPLAAVASLRAPGSKLIITRHLMFRLKNINRMLLRRVDAAIGVSEAVSEKLREIIPKEKVVCVHNGLNVEVREKREQKRLLKEFRFEHGIAYDVPLVTHIGALKKLKGHVDFINAASIIHDHNPRTKFVIIGKSNDARHRFRDELLSLVESKGLSEYVVFIDWMEDITPALVASDVFCSFSHSESFGLTVLEAMANRVPVVASRTDGHTELITDREEGLLFDIEDVETASDLVIQLLNNKDLRRNLAAAGEATAKEVFNVERMIEDTLRVYRYVWNS